MCSRCIVNMGPRLPCDLVGLALYVEGPDGRVVLKSMRKDDSGQRFADHQPG